MHERDAITGPFLTIYGSPGTGLLPGVIHMAGHRERQIQAVKPRLGSIREAFTSRRQFWATLRGATWQRNLAVLWIGELIAISGFSVTLPFCPKGVPRRLFTLTCPK